MKLSKKTQMVIRIPNMMLKNLAEGVLSLNNLTFEIGTSIVDRIYISVSPSKNTTYCWSFQMGAIHVWKFISQTQSWEEIGKYKWL